MSMTFLMSPAGSPLVTNCIGCENSLSKATGATAPSTLGAEITRCRACASTAGCSDARRATRPRLDLTLTFSFHSQNGLAADHCAVAVAHNNVIGADILRTDVPHRKDPVRRPGNWLSRKPPLNRLRPRPANFNPKVSLFFQIFLLRYQ